MNQRGYYNSSWSNYADSVVLYGTNDGSVNSTTIFSSYDPLEHTDIDFGNRATVVYNANTYGNNTWNENGAGGVHVWDNQADNDSDGGAGLFYNSEELWHDEMLMQFINQRVVNDGDNIHISYFDTETKAVKYHYIQSNDQTYGELQTWINLDGGSDGDDGNSSSQVVNVPRNNTYTVTAVLVSNGDTVASGQDIITLSNGTTYTAPAAGIVDGLLTVGDSLAGGTGWWGTDYTLFLVSDFNRVVEYGTGVRSNTVGAYSAIDVQTNGNPVVAYYDSSNQTVKLAVASANDPSAADWTLMTVMDAGDTNYQYSGKYISMKIDSNNDVHLVFYRNSTGDLIYMKSETDPINDGSYTFGDSVIIDSIGSVGAWADITMDENDSPVISYLDSSRADTFDGLKMAYYDSARI